MALAYDRVHRHQMQEAHPRKEVEALTKALAIKPGYPEALIQLARTDMLNETLPNLDLEATYRPAVKILKAAIGLNESLAESHRELGRAYAVLKENKNAMAEFTRAMVLEPDDAANYFALDHYSAKLDELEAAIAIYEQVIRDHPKTVLAQNALGKAYLAINKYEKSAEHYQQGIRIDPDDGLAHYQLARAYLFLGDRQAALAEHKRLEDLADRMEDDSLKGSYHSKAAELPKKIQEQ